MSELLGPDGKKVQTTQHMKPVVAQIYMSGDRAEFHAEMYGRKMREYKFDCGFDLYPDAIFETRVIGGANIFRLSTGVRLILPPGTYGRLVARSSSIEKMAGGQVLDGTIDAGYKGELFIRALCHFDHAGWVKDAIEDAIKSNLALAQIIVTPFCGMFLQPADFSAVATPRGDKGFGSTDTL